MNMAEDCLESGDHVDARGIFGYANFYLKKILFINSFVFILDIMNLFQTFVMMNLEGFYSNISIYS